MHAYCPYVAFESWLQRGLILEVVMQKRMLQAHVANVIKQLVFGEKEAQLPGLQGFVAPDGKQLYHLPFTCPMASMQSRLFQRYVLKSEEYIEMES